MASISTALKQAGLSYIGINFIGITSDSTKVIYSLASAAVVYPSITTGIGYILENKKQSISGSSITFLGVSVLACPPAVMVNMVLCKWLANNLSEETLSWKQAAALEALKLAGVTVIHILYG